MLIKFYGFCRHIRCGRNDCFDITKFCCRKKRRLDIAQEMLTTFNDDPDLLLKVVTGDETWANGYLKPKPKHRNGSVQKSQDRKKHAILHHFTNKVLRHSEFLNA